jgi:hypothetical protein
MPYFSIYELHTLMKGLGGAEKTRRAFDDFRVRCKQAGLPGLHLNAVAWGIQPDATANETVRDITGMDKPVIIVKDAADLVAALGIDSVTSYVWIHHVGIPRGGKYEDWGNEAVKQWPDLQQKFKVPYYPNVSIGWDSTPRTDQTQPFREAGYPHMSPVVGGTPALFRNYLAQAKAYLAQRPAGQRILTINSWNEWTEGSYLEPDVQFKMGYLEALKEVFPKKGRKAP